MDSNYKVAYDFEWNKLKRLNPLDISKRLDVKYLNDNKEFIIPFFENDYIIDFKNTAIYIKEDNKEPLIDDSIIMLNYLTYSTDLIINTNKWVTLKEIPKGVALFYPAFYKMTIKRLIETFSNNLENFELNSLKLGGKGIELGDKGYKFKVLPKINICVAMWSGDDEIEANATILFEPEIEHLLHIETIIGLGMCISNKLISMNKINKK